jgi:hypothetical protein
MKAILYLLIFALIYSRQTEIFPNKVGDHWVYRFNDSRIYVNIVKGVRLANGRPANTWTYQYPNGVDTNYVQTNNNETNIFHSNAVHEKLRYLMPLFVGESWVLNEEHGDTIQVIAQVSVTVPAGTFKNAFVLVNKIDRGVFIGNSKRVDSIWLVPYIGIVRRVQQEYQMSAALGNGVWELEKYLVK